MSGGEALRAEGLRVRLGRRMVIDGLDLPEMRPGEVTALIGPNGAGKSTLIRALARLAPCEGRVFLGDLDLLQQSAAAHARLTGYMPQAVQSGAALTVLEAVVTALRAVPDGDRSDPVMRAHAALERLGIAGLAQSRLDRLSGGQRQMASLAQAMVRGPRILLLDEPTSALDPGRQFEVMQAVQALVRESGIIAVVVLHDLELSLRWADRIVLMQAGAALASGAPEDVVTPEALGQAYGIDARIERCSRGLLHVHADGVLARHG
ncbi:ABC transporter ATP-binding protein [Pseudoroseicyclus aestuarii]|uniref:Iron complex transport system ATP-binding protein n=1 Tax=Pseudoroseicyclus aestuarii TaxID=1795041 RepID=A0A318T7W4_9RHOB|nr:ABC transporter ATP-binding protein [Pseudoroseicyclus aestuarii]PYE84488.1 iron complex transport system ATP-binding protein [Pseudoroseicyclus aestuarii]